MNWLTIVTTLIAAIAPSVVSIVTTIVQSSINKQNNEHQLNLNEQSYNFQLETKKFENYYLQKTESLNKYIDSLITYVYSPSEENLITYKLNMSKVCLYVSPQIYNDILDINSYLEEKKFDTVKNDMLRFLLDNLNREAKQYNENK